MVDRLKTASWEMDEGIGGMEQLLMLCWVVTHDTGPHSTGGNQLHRTTISPKMVPGTFWHCVKYRHEVLAISIGQPGEPGTGKRSAKCVQHDVLHYPGFESC